MHLKNQIHQHGNMILILLVMGRFSERICIKFNSQTGHFLIKSTARADHWGHGGQKASNYFFLATAHHRVISRLQPVNSAAYLISMAPQCQWKKSVAIVDLKSWHDSLKFQKI
jgi:hypothetical protein